MTPLASWLPSSILLLELTIALPLLPPNSMDLWVDKHEESSATATTTIASAQNMDEQRRRRGRKWCRTQLLSESRSVATLRGSAYLTDRKRFEHLRRSLAGFRPPRIQAVGDDLFEVNALQDADRIEGLIEGDIAVDPQQIDRPYDGERVRRQAVANPNRLWNPKQAISYEVSTNLDKSSVDAILAAIAFWSNNTCLRFVNDPNAANRIRFFKGTGCWSYVGRIGGVQDVSIGQGCDTLSTTTHELAHALGFEHTQSRVDRNERVYIDFGNVLPSGVRNFKQQSASENNNRNLPYDYGSVMHYSAYSYAVNPAKPTVYALDTRFQNSMGGRLPSFIDVNMMNALYCSDACALRSPSAKCQNGGYPDSATSCKTCKCPEGYGGADCSTRDLSKCGNDISVGATPLVWSAQVGDGNRTVSRLQYSTCYWRFQAPPGSRIKVLVQHVGYVCSSSCSYGGVELKLLADKRMGGVRLCCDKDVKNGTAVFESANNEMMLVLYNRLYYTTVTLAYQRVV